MPTQPSPPLNNPIEVSSDFTDDRHVHPSLVQQRSQYEQQNQNVIPPSDLNNFLSQGANQRDNMSVQSLTTNSQMSDTQSRQHQNEGSYRHKAHGSNSSESYTRSTEENDFQFSDYGENNEDHKGENLWDSLDEESNVSGRDRTYQKETAREGGVMRSSHGHGDDSSSSQYSSPSRKGKENRNGSGKGVPITSSFYDWAANNPNVAHENEKREYFEQSAQEQNHDSSPRQIDATHQELLESIDRQKRKEEEELSHHRSSRFPYYATVNAIESTSPHSYHGNPIVDSVPNLHSSGSSYKRVGDDSAMMHDSYEESQDILDDSLNLPHEQNNHYQSYDSTYSQHDEGGDRGITGEIARLEHVNKSLMLALQQERHEKALMETKFQSMQDNAVEIKTQHELVIESHRLEVIRLKGHIRRLSHENGFEDVLAGFEEDLARVVKEKDILKKRYATLEEKLFLLGNGADDLDEDDEYEGLGDKENIRSEHAPNSASKLGGQAKLPHSVVWTTEGMTSAGGEEVVNIKEFRILKHKYKRAQKAKDDIEATYESLKKLERKFNLGIKHSDQSAQRFRELYTENELMSEKLREAMKNLDMKTEEVKLLKYEAVALQDAERNIRSERSNILHELSAARSRLRECEAELKDQRYRNRFISKHGYVPDDNSSVGRVGPSQHHHQDSNLQQKQREDAIRRNQEYFDLLANSNSAFEHLVPLPNQAIESTDANNVTGLAGSCDAVVLKLACMDLCCSSN